MTKYHAQFDHEAHEWLVLMRCSDGIDDVLASYVTKAEAKAEIRRLLIEGAAVEEAERRHRAQYAYACGERD